MSYSGLVKGELLRLPVRRDCCRNALLYGLLYAASLGPSGRLTVPLPLSAGMPPDFAARLGALFAPPAARVFSLTPETRGAHRYLRADLSAPAAARRLAALRALPEAEADARAIPAAVPFRCPDCAAHFLRGLFVSAGTVSDPARSTHLAFGLPSDGRVGPVRLLLEENGCAPGLSVRDGRARLFYKSGDGVQGVLSLLGAAASVFELINAQIERDIRNNENRATNCVAENIHRATQAGNRQLSAIRRLEARRLLASLPPELSLTASLRLAHPEATLAELAARHEPPVTKSCVYRRLARIMDFCAKAFGAAETP